MADTPETQAPAEAAAPTGIKAKLPLMVAIIAGLAVGVGTGAVVIGPVAAKALGFGVPAASADATAEHAAEGEEGDHATDDSAAATGAAPSVLTLDNLVLNPAASGGTRFLLLTLAMECTDAASVTLLQSRDAELRDVVLSTLGGKTVEELADVSARDSIKTELITALNERFGKKTVVRLYFPQYVVQ
jgi:flagellar FliL protein